MLMPSSLVTKRYVLPISFFSMPDASDSSASVLGTSCLLHAEGMMSLERFRQLIQRSRDIMPSACSIQCSSHDRFHGSASDKASLDSQGIDSSSFFLN